MEEGGDEWSIQRLQSRQRIGNGPRRRREAENRGVQVHFNQARSVRLEQQFLQQQHVFRIGCLRSLISNRQTASEDRRAAVVYARGGNSAARLGQQPIESPRARIHFTQTKQCRLSQREPRRNRAFFFPPKLLHCSRSDVRVRGYCAHFRPEVEVTDSRRGYHALKRYFVMAQKCLSKAAPLQEIEILLFCQNILRTQ